MTRLVYHRIDTFLILNPKIMFNQLLDRSCGFNVCIIGLLLIDCRSNAAQLFKAKCPTFICEYIYTSTAFRIQKIWRKSKFKQYTFFLIKIIMELQTWPPFLEYLIYICFSIKYFIESARKKGWNGKWEWKRK